jgi:hypothetical protein
MDIQNNDITPATSWYIGKSISKLQMDIELKQIRVLIWKILLFLSIISLYIEALVPSFHKPLKTCSIKFFGLLSEPGSDFPLNSFIVGKMFSWKMLFKRAEQMEVAWSKVRAIRRMLKDFLFEILQRLICLVGSIGTRIVIQEQQCHII